jgi:hypothetical protein
VFRQHKADIEAGLEMAERDFIETAEKHLNAFEKDATR